MENEILHNNASPIFQASSLVFSPKPDGLSHSEPLGIMPGTPNSEETSNDDSGLRSGSPKKESTSLKLSKVIPVTGERPMPKDRSGPLDDDVLYAVFVILWEKDSTLQGMTVKQLSDHLLEKHPDMNNLSTKLSNLISAKLNAYVKKLEKGEKTLVYALSREWSNSSPRRMVYVYRGVLSPDYKIHTQAAAPVNVKKTDSNRNDDIDSSKLQNPLSNGAENLESSTNASNYTNKKLHSSNAFTLNSDFNVPYLTSPVSVVLTPNGNGGEKRKALAVSGDPQKGFQDEEDDIEDGPRIKRPNLGPQMVPFNNNGGEGSNYVTAAAAAPRISKLFTRNTFKTTSASNATGIMTAIHKVIYTQNPVESRRFSKLKNQQDNLVPAVWLKTLREGFLTDDIESPESISFEDLEGILNQA